MSIPYWMASGLLRFPHQSSKKGKGDASGSSKIRTLPGLPVKSEHGFAMTPILCFVVAIAQNGVYNSEDHHRYQQPGEKWHQRNIAARNTARQPHLSHE